MKHQKVLCKHKKLNHREVYGILQILELYFTDAVLQDLQACERLYQIRLGFADAWTINFWVLESKQYEWRVNCNIRLYFLL